MMSKKFVVLILFGILVVGCAEKQDKVLFVTAASGVDGLELGDTFNEVSEAFGAPLLAESELVADSLTRNAWSVGEGRLSMLMYHDRVIQMHIEGNKFEMPNGISSQSTIEQLRATYPGSEESIVPHDMENKYLDSVDEGIALSVRRGRPGEATNASGDVINVFVHLPGHEVIVLPGNLDRIH